MEEQERAMPAFFGLSLDQPMTARISHSSVRLLGGPELGDKL
jgi:hypothetical protein